jgi:DNA-binding transcriptional LysR family regulator
MLDARLLHVVAVAHAGSFTAAGEKIGLTQSAVTKSIADLEAQIGFAIFHRTSRGVVLTEEGRDFVERTARLLDDARELFRRPRGIEDVYATTIRVGVCPASLEWWLAGPLANLLVLHPSIRFDVSGSSFERMIHRLRNGGVDVALGFEAAFSEWSDLRRYPLASNDAVLFVRKGHPLTTRPSVTVQHLAEFNFVSPSDSRPYGALIREIYASQGVEWQQRLHIVDFFPLVRNIVDKSDAIGVVTDSLGHSAAFQERFATLDGLDLFPPSPLCCAVRARSEPTSAVRAFISACVSSMPPDTHRP